MRKNLYGIVIGNKFYFFMCFGVGSVKVGISVLIFYFLYYYVDGLGKMEMIC